MEKIVAVIGAGLIGRAWAMVFARAGWRVRLHDRDCAQLDAAHAFIAASLDEQAGYGLVTDPEAALARIDRVPALADALAGVDWVQENLPETLDVKREVFALLDRHTPAEAVLASSTSAIPASQFTAALPGRARCLVAHPVNPPHLVPVVELCGAPWTAPAVIERAKRVYAERRTSAHCRAIAKSTASSSTDCRAPCWPKRCGSSARVTFRPQTSTRRYATASVSRWSFMGPLATIELNAPSGIADYCARYGGFYRRLAEAPPAPSVWDADSAARVAGTLGPPADAHAFEARTRWRDRRLMALAQHKRRSNRKSNEGANVSANRKVIITCAVTGSIHTPSMSPHLPITPREIADAAVGAADAGAAIVHLHARDPVDGHPTQDPKYFREFAADIARRSDVVINFTTGGAATMTIEERLQPALQLQPEVASLNMGSMNFGLYPMLKRFPTFKFDWERPYLAGSEDRIFKNTFKDIEYILTSCADNGTRFEIECYDIGHLYTAAHFFERGVVKPPLFIQSVFGILGGIGPHPDDVAHMKRTADRLFGDQYRWSVLGAGRNQLPIASMSAAMGGNVRVGLEDSLWLGPGKLAESNAAQVRAVRQIIEAMGLDRRVARRGARNTGPQGPRQRRVLGSGRQACRRGDRAGILPLHAHWHDLCVTPRIDTEPGYDSHVWIPHPRPPRSNGSAGQRGRGGPFLALFAAQRPLGGAEVRCARPCRTWRRARI